LKLTMCTFAIRKTLQSRLDAKIDFSKHVGFLEDACG